MNTRTLLSLSALAFSVSAAWAAKDATTISGNYLEVRSCDVYTGPCFANAEMGLTGTKASCVWSVREGSWRGTRLDGLSVVAVVRTDNTLGDLKYQPRAGKAVLIVDEKANAQQKEALVSLAQQMAGNLIYSISQHQVLADQLRARNVCKSGCAKVKAGELVEVATRCLGSKDHVCGNEEAFYPPLTAVTGATPAYTEMAAFKGADLGVTWESTLPAERIPGGILQVVILLG